MEFDCVEPILNRQRCGSDKIWRHSNQNEASHRSAYSPNGLAFSLIQAKFLIRV